MALPEQLKIRFCTTWKGIVHDMVIECKLLYQTFIEHLLHARPYIEGSGISKDKQEIALLLDNKGPLTHNDELTNVYFSR